MNKKGVQVSNDFLLALHKELIEIFSSHYSVEIKTLTVFQLYGFENYEEELPSLKKLIIEKTGKWINGKYLYNKKREIEKGTNKLVNLRRDYLSLLISTIGYKDYNDFLKSSPYITTDARLLEETNKSSSEVVETLYYIGYYVEDRQYYIRSKFTIYEMKTALWEILYWERDNEPTFYSYYGKCVPIGDITLSFYFNNENSSLNKECFINLFYGNKMQNKPILLGAYCGFNRHNNPVIGKIIFEQAIDIKMQEEKVLRRDINPIFYNYLYSQRIVIDNILPYNESDLLNSSNGAEIMSFLKGEYYGFYCEKNNYLVPIIFQIINDLGELKLQINNKPFQGIGRISRIENFLISEFSEKINSYSQFSIQIQPLEKDLFMGHMLVYIGANVLNGKVLLWKNNDELKILTTGGSDYYLDKSDLDSSFVNKIDKYLDS
ncbi:hypothetical protein [Elizabethkingia anophelis]|uniref:hypothetical protein n=1 Tax=Elizabethkingia anophelis TaxID=1117645 RepID=UPI001629EEB1|nr:hypothetical protein [Elizabethkingia anophelis]MCT4214557.1 hypothetical protein [Elizabethkingia anophelis]MCT4323376.1 hypothetical protein [Elizabethkingia anophelis]HAY3535758.1 hypothetical protein [Elizabethkingia anophelis]HAY3547975.1 hypothetical protein [Elizabethkingia anophelis]HAY3592784.1 hypothetical protein [Elizabethkingia anophelis]